MKLELKVNGNIFGIVLDDVSYHPHFYIKCRCGGANGKYSGMRFGGEEKRESKQGFDCSFYMAPDSFEELIEGRKNSLILICNDCGNDFPFDLKTYWSLLKQIKMKKQKTEE